MTNQTVSTSPQNDKSNNDDQQTKWITRLETDFGVKIMQLQTEINDLKKAEAQREEKMDALAQQVREYTRSLETVKEVELVSVANDDFEGGENVARDDDTTNNAAGFMDSVSAHRDNFGHHYLPSDSYTFFAVAQYFNGYAPTRAFVVASATLVVQLVLLIIFIADVFDHKNPENLVSVPPGVGVPVWISQVVALLISCWSQDEIRTSINVMALGYDEEQLHKISRYACRSKWYLSIFLRIFTGCLTLMVTFILIINSVTVRDVMLDFAAVTFVSEIDNGAFLSAQWRFLGKKLHELTVKTKHVPAKKTTQQDFFKVPRLVCLLIIMGIMCGVWAWITIRQSSGYYMDDTIFVQFGDDFSPVMAAFSGLYRIEVTNALAGMRVTYVELKAEELQAESAVFYYCIQDSSWMFQYGDHPNGDGDFFSECGYKARSSETEDLDITKASSITWYVSDDMTVEMPMQHFYVTGQRHYFGKSCESDGDCGDRMYCEEDKNRTKQNSFCICEEGYFGRNCEFLTPCGSIEIDTRDVNGFIGTRAWSRRYTSVQESGRESPVQVYGKPVFFGDTPQDGIDIMMFTGRRWILTDSAHIESHGNSSFDNNPRNLAEFLSRNFHAYWSNYTFFFATEPVDVGTPTDSATPVGLQWFRFEASGAEGVRLQSGENILQEEIIDDVNLICAVCNNETNPCFYGATCQQDGTCSCTTGSSGKLCQIPPAGNGLCDSFFNTPEFSFDGGDCCEETCISTEQYSCGNGIINTRLNAYGFVGYPNCLDPRFSRHIHGSTTLHKIINRGRVQCGSSQRQGFVDLVDGIYSGFEVDLCKSIAAAALGNPEAFEIVDTPTRTRFIDLSEDKFDVLIKRVTNTAERDIYQSDAKVGFSFVPTPEIYDGVRFGGIPPFSECADKLDFGSAECNGLKICVRRDASWLNIVQNIFPDQMIVQLEGGQLAYHGLEEGLCNVIAGEFSTVAEYAVRGGGFTGANYQIGENIYSKEPLALVTREDDRIWSKFVSWVLEALIQAEESGITKSTASYLAATDVFGEPFRDMFKNAVGANGNYGEIYEKNLGDLIPRSGLNTINKGNSGTIYAFPFGSIETRGNDPIVGGSIEAIRRRGSLNCGIRPSLGFAEFDLETGQWFGFEVDFCRGIAAALFSGSPNVNFIPLPSSRRFPALAEGVIDVLTAGTTHTLTREVREEVTGEGFDFTPTIFHDGMGFGGRSPFVSCAESLTVGNVTISADCANSTKICVPDGTTWLEAMRGPLNIPEENILVVVNHDQSIERLVSGDCNVIAGESTQLAAQTVRGKGYALEEEYFVGSRRFTKEPLAIVSRSDDTQFSDFLRWVVHGFFYAAEQEITRLESYSMPSTNLLFGDLFSGMWQHPIAVVGNYDEIFERNFAGILKREGLNTVNNANGPQFIAKPGVVINNY